MSAERLAQPPGLGRPILPGAKLHGPRLAVLARPSLRPPLAHTAEQLGVRLLREGAVAPDDIVLALALHARQGGRLADILLARGMIDPGRLFTALANHWDVEIADFARVTPDPRLIDRWGAGPCLRDGLLPWRQIGPLTVIATAYPEDFARHRPALTARFGRVAMALTRPEMLEAALLKVRGRSLNRRALMRVPEPESCRHWGAASHVLWLRALAVSLIAGCVLAPLVLLWGLVVWAVLTLMFSTGLKAVALLSQLRHSKPEPPPPALDCWPVVSVMVPLFQESDIAPRLVRRLSRLDYPRERLDILLVVEEVDAVTRAALRRSNLPAWMRVVLVPDGTIRTKPRALNHALDQCRGSIIGLYDAEDAPEPDQISKVVARFRGRGPEVACLQGRLDFYNPHTNWLSRCFTMEYAAWFRIMLPGLARLGLPIPLGGTTLFFRRDTLEELGAWDACNVTEDADLGIRLARHGYRTELIDTTTFEEANCRALPWVKQRSRWLKGYMMTYGVHMRDPGLLLRQLGWWKFAGFQALFLCTLSQFLLAPVLWSFWLVPMGVEHPIFAALPKAMGHALIGVFLFTEAVQMAITLTALRLTPNRLSALWAPTMHLYFPLAALAAYKAAWEMVHKPFWWDKTTHGLFDPAEED